MDAPSLRVHLNATEMVKRSLGIPGEVALGSILRERRSLGRGQQLYRQGDVAADVYFVLSGVLKACRFTNEGEEGILRFYYPGELMWADGTASGRHSMSAVCIDKSRVCSMPLFELQRIMSNYASVRVRCYELLTERIEEEQAFIDMLCGADPERRVAFFLLQVYRHGSAGDYELDVPMTRLDIARYLGLGADTVSLAFRKLESKGIVHVDGRRLRVVDSASLRHLAGRRGNA